MVVRTRKLRRHQPYENAGTNGMRHIADHSAGRQDPGVAIMIAALFFALLAGAGIAALQHAFGG